LAPKIYSSLPPSTPSPSTSHSHFTTFYPQGTIVSSNALSQIATNIFKQMTILQSINTSQEEKQKEKKKSIKSIHPYFMKMIPFASSEDGTDAPTDPSCL